MPDAELIVAKATVTVDGVPGIEVLAICGPKGDVTLACDGQHLASSENPAEENLFRLRTARGAVFQKLRGLLDELEAAVKSADAARAGAAAGAIKSLRDQLGQV